jgi:pimeloyl-ACP methyl ester carboxylesterase
MEQCAHDPPAAVRIPTRVGSIRRRMKPAAFPVPRRTAPALRARARVAAVAATLSAALVGTPLVASAGVAARASATPDTATETAATRTIELTDCRLPHPAGLGSVPARCGTLVVPEDYANPQVRRFALHVAVVPSLDRRGGREPLFVIPGGPGQAASTFYAAYAGAFAQVARTRDIVLVDQRGTGASSPLTCDFPADFETGAFSPDLLRELSATCRRGLKGRPEFFTTSVAVRDLEAVRAALAYPAIALYGVSYGTRVAQHYVRRHPERVSAVVLDGVLAPDVPLGPQTPFHAQHALELMFRRCVADQGCAGAFPELERRFDELRGRLVMQPARLTLPDPATGRPRDVEFGAEQLIGAVRLLNYATASTALLPLFMDRAANGDYAPMAGQLLMLGSMLDAQIAYGMNAAVVCTEDVPHFGVIDRAALAKTYFGATQLDGLKAMCEGWPSGVVDADLRAPLRSTVPALLLSGEADPVTPPDGAARAATGFADAKHVVVRGQGHGQIGVGCASRLVATFLDAKTAKGLDATCLESAAPAPFFLDATGPAP